MRTEVFEFEVQNVETKGRGRRAWGIVLWRKRIKEINPGLAGGRAVAFPSPQWYDCHMKTKIWINKANSFEDARDFDSAYYLNLTSAERIETVQILREAHFQSTGSLSHENGKRLRRVFRIIKQA